MTTPATATPTDPAPTAAAPAAAAPPAADGSAFHRRVVSRLGWLWRVRPMAAAAFLVRLLAPDERRRIITTADGLRLYADPFSHLGQVVLETGTFEPETAAVFRAELRPGDAVLDVGANEGVFSALAGTLVGPTGTVAAVEPQERLRDILEINLRINNVGRFFVFQNAMGEAEGSQGQLNLYPALNTGSSGMTRTYRFSRRVQPVAFVSPESVFRTCGVERFDFVKVDVEGFEHKVVEALLPSVRAGRVRALFLDYHVAILNRLGVDPANVHRALLSAGMVPAGGDPARLESYVLYRWNPAAR